MLRCGASLSCILNRLQFDGGPLICRVFRDRILPPTFLQRSTTDLAGERILPAAITTMVITEGSTIAIPVRNAGVVKVERFSFAL